MRGGEGGTAMEDGQPKADRTLCSASQQLPCLCHDAILTCTTPCITNSQAEQQASLLEAKQQHKQIGQADVLNQHKDE